MLSLGADDDEGCQTGVGRNSSRDWAGAEQGRSRAGAGKEQEQSRTGLGAAQEMSRSRSRVGAEAE